MAEPSARVATLVVYLEALDAAVELSEQQEQFDRLWEIRRDVVKTQEECIRLWREALRKKVEELYFQVQEHGVAATIQTEHSDSQTLRSQIEALELLRPSDDGALPKTITRIGMALKLDLQERISSLVLAAQAQEQKDRGGEKIEPLKGDSGEYRGSLERLFRDLQGIDAKMNGEAVSFWLSRIPVLPGVANTAKELSERIQQCAETISDLQRRRYNLWALREIYTGGESSNWDEYLGRIDIGLLHPSVHTCYSIERDERLRREDDLQVRQKSL